MTTLGHEAQLPNENPLLILMFIMGIKLIITARTLSEDSSSIMNHVEAFYLIAMSVFLGLRCLITYVPFLTNYHCFRRRLSCHIYAYM